jgi:sulfur carrier protein
MTETIMAKTSAPGLTLSVNGAPMAVPQGSTVLDLLALCGLPAQKIALERNLEIVPRSAYGSTLLEAGDAIEIVHFIGGG